jgi:hypothetical protein
MLRKLPKESLVNLEFHLDAVFSFTLHIPLDYDD